MTRQEDEAQSMMQGGIRQTIDGVTPAAPHLDNKVHDDANSARSR
jgi:hypothetical protein